MKKLKFAARILLPFFVLISLVSCKNLIDTVDILGYKYVLTELNDDNIQLYQNVAEGHFSYEFIFASSGNGVTRVVVTGAGASDREETAGTFSVYSDRLTLAFPDETITLTYTKSNGTLKGKVKLPLIEDSEEGKRFVMDRTKDVTASFRAFARVD